MKWKLKRTKQCANCPWRKNSDPFKIKGYVPKKHCELKKTIASGISIHPESLSIMACHHSKEGAEEHCIGWLRNQLGVGNNIALRINMLSCENAKEIVTYGEQFESFEETLPKNRNQSPNSSFKSS